MGWVPVYDMLVKAGANQSLNLFQLFARLQDHRGRWAHKNVLIWQNNNWDDLKCVKCQKNGYIWSGKPYIS